MQAVILAGGLGTRLRPFTDVIPKPLLPLGGKPILAVQLAALRRFGVGEVFVATNYMSDLVEAYLGDGSKYGLRVHVSREDEPLGTCGPLALLRDRLAGPFLVMNGDILTKLDFGAFRDFAAARDGDLVVGTKAVRVPVRYGSVTADDGGRVLGMVEKPDLTMDVLAGVYCMKPGVLRFIPDGTYFGMDSLIQAMLAAGAPVYRYPIADYWLDIGMAEDYSKARDEYQAHFADGP